ncbi:glycosyltransferase family 2 protein [Halosimplex marinum]|uniref:glycosyltransferase family 2 protein n=1 Tax=Halosimplex marinum TaxID=3396620 RepID=UPI003F56E43D
MGRAIETTVGIATHMRPAYLDDLLERLGEQTRPADEILVIDDSPDDRSREVVADHREHTFSGTPTELRYERMAGDGTNQQDARNRIVGDATGDLLCFLDDDTVPVEEWLEETVAAYESDPSVVGVGGPALRTDEDLELVDEVDPDPPARNRVTEYGEVVDASGMWVPEQPVYTDILRGANMTFETEALRRVGGFDNSFGGPAIFEEWDLMVRVSRACGDLVYHPDVVVYHIEAESGGSRAADKSQRPGTYWYARNSLLFRKKLFDDRYYRSLARLFCRGTESGIAPVWRRLVRLPVRPAEYHWLRGYADGILKESASGAGSSDGVAGADDPVSPDGVEPAPDGARSNR